MDPTTLAAAAVGFIVRYLLQAADRTAQNVTETVADRSIPLMGRLYQAVRSRFKGSSYEEAQIQGVEEKPESPARQEALRAVLAEILTEDAEFAKLIEKLMIDIRDAGGTRVEGQNSGAVAGRDVNIQGRYAAGRDIHLSGDGVG